MTIKGALIVTDQDNMNDGLFRVFVYEGDFAQIVLNEDEMNEVECDYGTAKDPGENSQGGAFNCNKYGD